MITTILTLLGSSFFSSAWQFVSQWKEDNTKIQLAKLSLEGAAASLQIKEMANARSTDSDSVIKRLLAILVVFVVFVLPDLIMIFKPEMIVTLCYYDFLGGSKEVLKYVSCHGFVIFPFQTLIAEMVLGYYFGRAIVKRG